MEELGLEGQRGIAPEGLLGAEADVTHLVVVQGGEILGQLVANWLKRVLRARVGELCDGIPIHGAGGAPARGQPGTQQCRGASAQWAQERRKRGQREEHALYRANPVPA